MDLQEQFSSKHCSFVLHNDTYAERQCRNKVRTSDRVSAFCWLPEHNAQTNLDPHDIYEASSKDYSALLDTSTQILGTFDSTTPGVWEDTENTGVTCAATTTNLGLGYCKINITPHDDICPEHGTNSPGSIFAEALRKPTAEVPTGHPQSYTAQSFALANFTFAQAKVARYYATTADYSAYIKENTKDKSAHTQACWGWAKDVNILHKEVLYYAIMVEKAERTGDIEEARVHCGLINKRTSEIFDALFEAEKEMNYAITNANEEESDCYHWEEENA